MIYYDLNNTVSRYYNRIFCTTVSDFVCVHVTKTKPEDQWSCIAHLSADDMLKSVVIEEKKFNIALG